MGALQQNSSMAGQAKPVTLRKFFKNLHLPRISCLWQNCLDFHQTAALMTRYALRHKLALLLFISTLLLCVQMAALTHAVDHPFHQHTEQCDAFLSFKHNSALATYIAALAITAILAVFFMAVPLQLLSRTLQHYSIRAPPVFVSLH